MALHITNLGNYNVTLKFYDWKSTWQSWMNEQGMKSLDKVEFMVAEGANRQSDWGNGSIWKAVKTYTNATPDSLNNITFTFDVSKYVTPASGRFVSFKILMTYTRSSDNVSGNYFHSTGYQASIIANTFGVNALFVYANANSTPTNLSLTSTTNKLSAPIHISYNNSSGGTWGTKYRIFLSLCKDAALNEGVYHTVVESTSSTSFDYDLRNYLIIAEMESNIRDYKDLYVKLWVTAIDNYGLTESVRAECSTILHLYNDTYNVFSKTADGQKAIGMSNIIYKDSLISTGMKVKILEDGSKWGRIFWHDVSTTSTWFASAAEAKDCNLSNRFSKLGKLDSYRHNDKYEFMLCYPRHSTTKYNRWIQTANPLTTTANATQTADTMGYRGVHIDFTTNWKYGIGLSSSSQAFMDCEAGHTNWYGGIGLYSAYQGGFPAPTENGMSNVQKEVELWVRLYNSVNIAPSTLNDTIYLRTSSDFYTFCNNINNGKTYKGKTVILLTDVSTSGANEHKDFNPAGDISHPFEGIFDGNGHTINMKYVENNEHRLEVGLFGVNYGTIKNLRVTNMYVNVYNDGGIICGSNVGIIENCCVSGALIDISPDGTSEYLSVSAGGIAGMNEGIIRKCIANISISVSDKRESFNIGGITGYNYLGDIISCRTTGTITSKGAADIGGVSGVSTGNIVRCVNYLNITTNTSSGTHSGGIIGYSALTESGKKLVSCVNFGNGAKYGISGDNNGGIIGSSPSGLEIINCYYANNYNSSGTDVGDVTIAMSLSAMKSDDMANKLGSIFFFYDSSYDTKQFIKFNWEKVSGWANGESYGTDIFHQIPWEGKVTQVTIIASEDWGSLGGKPTRFEFYWKGNLYKSIINPPRSIEFQVYGNFTDDTYDKTQVKWYVGDKVTVTKSGAICPPVACFIKGTKVLTTNGLVPIEDVKVGDLVLSKNENDDIEEQKVYHTYNHNPRSCI